MRLQGLGIGALFTVLALASVTPAVSQAATYEFSPEVITPTASGSASVVDTNTTSSTVTFTDDFEFTLNSSYDTSVGALFYEHIPSANAVITEANLALYSGTPGSGTLISQTGFEPISTSPGVDSTFQNDGLANGNYYVEASIVVPASDIGDYSVSAFVSEVSGAPEPSTWAMMILGVALMGGALRYSRKPAGLTAA